MSVLDRDLLQGSCSCGRNQYAIQIPEDVADHAQIYFDDSSDNRMPDVMFAFSDPGYAC